MTDFQAYNGATHPIVRLEDDWNNLLEHGLVKPASFIIRKNGSYYEAINGSTGKIDYGGSSNVGGVDGTDAAAITQSVLDNGLTNGRTWKEKVIIAGNLLIDTQINVPAYTTIEIQGKLTATTALTDAVLYASALNDIEIYGGIIDVNGKDCNGIHLRNGENYNVYNTLVKNVSIASHIAIITTGTNSGVYNNTLHTVYSGIYVAGENIVAAGNKIYSVSGDVGIGTEFQDWAAAPSRYITISGNTIKVASYGIELRNCENSSAVGNNVYGGLGAGTKGIMIANAAPYTTIQNSVSGNTVSSFEDGIDLLTGDAGVYGNAVDSNIVYGCSNSGIRFQGANKNTATGNQLINDFCGYDINGDSNVITGGSARLNTSPVIERAGRDNNQIVGLRCEDNTNPMTLVGANTILNTHDCYDNSYWLTGNTLNIGTTTTNLYQTGGNILQTDNNLFALGNMQAANVKVTSDFYSSDGTGGATQVVTIAGIELHFKCGIFVEAVTL